MTDQSPGQAESLLGGLEGVEWDASRDLADEPHLNVDGSRLRYSVWALRIGVPELIA